MCKIAEYRKYKNTVDESGLFSTFFTSIGTTVHEGVQDWIGKTGKILADWQCTNLDCKNSKCQESECNDKNCINPEHVSRIMQVGHICKSCGKPMKYNELEVAYNIITGHVDIIAKVGKGKYWAGDFKTAGLKKIEEITSPSVGYLYQISSYAWILKNVYGINIVGFSIFYITRDSPGTYKEFKYDFDEEAEAKAKKLIDREIKKYKSAEKALKTKDVMHAIDTKPCKSKDHYHKIYGKYPNCPFEDVCFGSQSKFKKAIEERLITVTNRKTLFGDLK